MDITAEATDAGKRLDAFLHERLPEFSRSRLQSWIKENRVLIAGQPLRPSYLLRGSETVHVEPAQLPALKAVPEDLPLEILYEDQDVIVVDKPAGMVVHAGAGHHEGTLVNALLHRFDSLSSGSGDLRPGIVHRLDKDTSGVLVVARTDKAHRALALQFRNREVEKVYLALVHGRMKTREGRVTTPIARDPVRRTRMTAKLASGRSALTDYRVLEELGLISHLEVTIGTGRTHQIRVHLSSIRHPIIGDRLYGAPAQIPGLPALNRFFLHAHRLRFLSPSTGQPISIESPLPPELVEFLRAARQRG
ncbi:MAG TPA: RluA family pseudouridine synthase [Bryobacteraceae bacterium]|nr:RluA family pseudouridine synthase [Bryobacteraceae bacterium]